MTLEMKRCKKCVLSSHFPGIRFNTDDICSLCEEALSPEQRKENQQILQKKMADAINAVRGQGEYDIIVAFSGGKDSSYTLMKLVNEYQLRCLAVTIDNGFISEQAKKNCYAITAALNVDFMLFAPSSDFMLNLYRQSINGKTNNIHTQASLKRASALCNSCINLINNYVIKIALQHNTPLIAGGYVSGQVPRDAAVLQINLKQREQLKTHLKPHYKDIFGEAAEKFFFVSTNLLNHLEQMTIINPMLTVPVSENEMIDSIVSLGWVPVRDTGKHSSNCKLNDLGIAIHYHQHQFHPYEYELAEQVRYGLLDRKKAIEKLEEIPSFSSLKSTMDKI